MKEKKGKYLEDCRQGGGSLEAYGKNCEGEEELEVLQKAKNQKETRAWKDKWITR